MNLDRRHVLAGLAGLAGAALTARPALAQPWIPPPPDQELRVPVRGGRIYARVNGDLAGPRAPVLFAHGGPGGNHSSFLAALALAAERAVILYDQLDAGLSDQPGDPANWTVERFVSEIDALRAALGLQRFHLVGHSWGGTVALEYGARAPGGLLSLTLGSPLISTRSWEVSTTAQLAKLPRDIIRTINAHEAAGTTTSPEYVAAMDVFYAAYDARGPRPAYFQAYREARGLKLNGKVYRAMWGPGEIRATGTLRTYDGERLLSRIRAPSLVVCGEYDEMTADVLKPLVRLIPGGTLTVIPGAGHALASTHAPGYLPVLRGHLARWDART